MRRNNENSFHLFQRYFLWFCMLDQVGGVRCPIFFAPPLYKTAGVERLDMLIEGGQQKRIFLKIH